MHVVCKDWNALITSPHFICCHSIRAFYSKRRFLLFRYLRRRKDTKYFGLDHHYSLHVDNRRLDLFRILKLPSINGFEFKPRIVGSSNGLVCLIAHSDFALWNPTIQKYVLLPKVVVSPRIGHVVFGFDPTKGDYKIVILVTCDERVDSAWVFSYLTWSWKHVTNTISTPHPCHVEFSHVFINGVHHWIARSLVLKRDILLTFDASQEVFGEIMIPRYIRGFTSLVAARDTIALSRRKYVHLDVPIWPLWVMRQYGVDESWEILIKENELDPMKVLDVKKNGDVILELEGNKIVRYSPSTLTTNVQGVRGHRVDVDYYMENLCLLDKGEHVISDAS